MLKLSKLFKATDKGGVQDFNRFVLFDADKKAFIYTNAHILIVLPACWVNINTEEVTQHLLIPFEAIQAADKDKVSVLTDAGLKVDGYPYSVFPAEQKDNNSKFVNYKINDAGVKVEQFTYPNYKVVIPGGRTLDNSTPVHFIGLDIKYIRVISEFFESGVKGPLLIKFVFDSNTRGVVLDCSICLQSFAQDGWELPFVMLMPRRVNA